MWLIGIAFILLITKDIDKKAIIKKDKKIIPKDLNDICEECKKKDESVSHNLILTGFKLCKSCRLSKTIFPI